MPNQNHNTPAFIIDVEATDNTPQAEATELGWRRIHFNEAGHIVAELMYSDISDGIPSHAVNCKPDRAISFGAMAVTHITPDIVVDAPSHKWVVQQMLPSGEAYIIGHNVDFDIQVAANAGVDVSQYKAICTLALARELMPEVDSHSLGALIYYLFPDDAKRYLKNAHSAGWDVTFTYWLLKHLVELAGVTDTESLYQASEKARIPTIMPIGKFKGERIADMAKNPSGRGFLSWVINTIKDKPYLVKACQQALDNK